MGRWLVLTARPPVGQWFEGLGSFTSVRKVPTFSSAKTTIGPDSPVVLTLKVLFTRYGLPLQQQGDWGRAQLLTTPFREYERAIRTQLTEMFSGSGFDAARDIAGIVLNRWGHAYVSPQPGFFSGATAILRHALFCGRRRLDASRSPIQTCQARLTIARQSAKRIAPSANWSTRCWSDESIRQGETRHWLSIFVTLLQLSAFSGGTQDRARSLCGSAARSSRFSRIASRRTLDHPLAVSPVQLGSVSSAAFFLLDKTQRNDIKSRFPQVAAFEAVISLSSHGPHL